MAWMVLLLFFTYVAEEPRESNKMISGFVFHEDFLDFIYLLIYLKLTRDLNVHDVQGGLMEFSPPE